MRKSRLILIVLMMFFSVNGFATKSPETRVDYTFRELQRRDTPGAAVAITHEGKVVYLKGFGAANLEYGIPVTPQTVFDIASLSKQFTGMAIAMLVEQGKISLADDVRKHIPEVPDFGKTITLRHLVHHTSGIRDWTETLPAAGWRLDDVISFEQILKMVKHQQKLNFDPGEEYLYSNTNYNLLAEVIQRVTGKSFQDWTWENIFKPLGMTKTRFRADHREIIKNKAYPYRYDRTEGYLEADENLAAVGSNSMYSTGADMAKWLLNLETGKVGGKTAIREMFSKGVLNSGEEIDYACGLQVDTYKGLKRVYHNGKWAGFLTAMQYYPDQAFGVVILGNLTDYSYFTPKSWAQQIADIYLEEHMKKEEKPKQGEQKTVKVSPMILKQYEGRYWWGPNYIITIFRQENRLMMRTPYRRKYQLSPLSETQFKLRRGPLLNFQKDGKGNVIQFIYQSRGSERKVEKLEDITLTPRQMQAFTGTYHCGELDAWYTIILRSGKLVVTHRRRSDITLIPGGSDRFYGSGTFRKIIFSRNKQGEIIGFEIHHPRLRNIFWGRRPHPKEVTSGEN
jgi:CubicO group peptidase (beta-lactamase class C family)